MTTVSRDYYDFTMAHVRLTVLRTLLETTGYVANDSVLSGAVERLGFPVTRDQLRGQLSWLAEQGLIETSAPSPTVIVATLRERGADVACGKSTIAGVQRPSPGR